MDALLIFARHPRPGFCKTRLIPAIGAAGAAELHRRMTARTVLLARRAAQGRAMKIVLRVDGAAPEEFARTFGPDLLIEAQGDGDLGCRLSAAFDREFDAGSNRVAAIGTDCPGLTEEILAAAFGRLEKSDAVLGPAADGGYYLIGLKARQPRLFEEVGWGGADVLKQTLENAGRMNLSTSFLPELSDVDEPADLANWEEIERREAAERAAPQVSVVIPALDEAAEIGECIASAWDPCAEVIVADGGSADATEAIARSHGARVVRCGAGRVRQMNAGAASARGKVLIFLHADTRLPRGFAGEVLAACADPRRAGGAFRLRIAAPGFAFRAIEAGANFRSTLLRLPYGDQAIFAKAAAFQAAGGFPEQPIMEDAAFVRRLGRQGGLTMLDSAASTSARRWKTGGVFRTSALHLAAMTLFLLGAPAHGIASLMRRFGPSRGDPAGGPRLEDNIK